MMNETTKTEVESAVFRRLLKHLDENKDVQNIDLMNLANFCRNCLSKWYVSSAAEQQTDIDYEQAREIIYGIPFAEWKAKYQSPATEEQLAIFDARSKISD